MCILFNDNSTTVIHDRFSMLGEVAVKVVPFSQGNSGRFIDISMTAWAFAKAGQADAGPKKPGNDMSLLFKRSGELRDLYSKSNPFGVLRLSEQLSIVPIPILLHKLAPDMSENSG